MNTNDIYQRQESMELTIPSGATVVGCGGTGFWTAIFLAMSGIKEISLIDEDTVDASNLNRLMLHADNIGNYKTQVTANIIRGLRPECRVEIHQGNITSEGHCEVLYGTVFCCTDSIESQRLINAYCIKNKLPYRRVGYDGTTLNVSRAFPLSFVKEEQQGYTETPSWVIPAVLAAALGVYAELKNNIVFMSDISQIVACDMSWMPFREIMDKLRNDTSNLRLVDTVKQELRVSLKSGVMSYLADDSNIRAEAIRNLLEDENIKSRALDILTESAHMENEAIKVLIEDDVLKEEALKQATSKSMRILSVRADAIRNLCDDTDFRQKALKALMKDPVLRKEAISLLPVVEVGTDEE